MAESSPVARSPIVPAAPIGLLGGWEISRRQSSAALRLRDLTACTKLSLHAPLSLALSELMPPFGQARHVPVGLLIVAAMPEQWLLIAPPAAGPTIRDWLSSNLDGSPLALTDLTHARMLLRVSGIQSAMLLSKVCALDFRVGSFPCGRAVRSSLAKVPCEIIRDDLPYAPSNGPFTSTVTLSYLIICDWPVGQYIFETLVDAGREYDIDVDGFVFD